MSANARDVDFGKRSDDYSEHRPGFPSSFYARLQSFVSIDGAHALDVGTGPGTIALELAKRGADTTGIDISERQIDAAKQGAARAGLTDRCRFVTGCIEQTDFAANSFDLATAGQCWIWFDENAAIKTLLRVLKPGGVLVVANYCYLPGHSELAKATEDLVLEHNPGWTMAGHNGLYPQQIDPLILGGFELVEQFCYDHNRFFTHAGWRGRMRTCNGVGSGRLSDDRVDRFDSALAELLRLNFSDEPIAVRHRIWATVVRHP